jgi:hypothetical protein
MLPPRVTALILHLIMMVLPSVISLVMILYLQAFRSREDCYGFIITTVDKDPQICDIATLLSIAFIISNSSSIAFWVVVTTVTSCQVKTDTHCWWAFSITSFVLVFVCGILATVHCSFFIEHSGMVDEYSPLLLPTIALNLVTFWAFVLVASVLVMTRIMQYTPEQHLTTPFISATNVGFGDGSQMTTTTENSSSSV